MMTQSNLEHELFKNLLEKIRSISDQSDFIQRMQQKAWQRFLEFDLPKKNNEIYRHIKLKQLFSKPYEFPVDEALAVEEIKEFIFPECQESVIVFLNGKYHPHLSCIVGLPKKIVISSLEDASQTFGAFLNNHWSQSLKEETDSFALMNAALYQKGLFIYLPPNSIVETPIQILHIISSQVCAPILFPRIQIFVGANSDIKLISSQKSLGCESYFVNQVEELVLDDNAHVHYSQDFCGEKPQSWHFDSMRATLKKNSTLKSVCVTEGSATVRTDYRVALCGENAEALLNSLWMLSDKSEAHSHVFMDHQAPNCRSFQLFKGVLNDFSRSSFEGKIMVRQKAQKTEAFQLNNNLILHDYAHADSKPNLEIFADDVKASHGATVGQLDLEQLFYLKTRGFSDEDARSLLIFGFCEQMIEMFDLNSLKKEITQKARNYLKKR